MKNRFLLLSVLLLTALLFVSCSQTSELPSGGETGSTDTTADGTTDAAVDQFAEVRRSGEEWILVGLKAYEDGSEPEYLKDFFSESSNLTYLTLYDHFFTYNMEKSVPVAEALFRFIVDEHGADALLDSDKRIEYKNEFLESLGLQPQYIQTPEVEYLLASMDFSSSSEYKYIIKFDRATYYFKDFSLGSPTQYHMFLYCNTVGLHEMIEYLKENELDAGLDTEREFNFYMTLDGSTVSRTSFPGGNMYINDFYSALHEAMHAMGIRDNGNIWLSEGICSYFGEMLGFNDLIAASNIQMLTLAKEGYFDERAAAGEEYSLGYKTLYEMYSARGGLLDNVDNFDLRLYSDIFSAVVSDLDDATTVGEIYESSSQKEYEGIGGELTYAEAKSLVLYLADVYGIDKVLDAYRTQDISAAFGKDYEGLKVDWRSYIAQLMA